MASSRSGDGGTGIPAVCPNCKVVVGLYGSGARTYWCWHCGALAEYDKDGKLDLKVPRLGRIRELEE